MWQGFDPDAELDALHDQFQRWNEWLVSKADTDADFRDALFKKCSDGIEGKLFWIDSFGYTLVTKSIQPHRKIVLRSIQERYMRWRHSLAIAQKSGVIVKSREVGATWCNCYDDAWWWLFMENGNIKIGSRTEALVDGAGDPDAIMPKIDYLMERLPDWMKPDGYGKKYRSFKKFVNPVTTATIKGEATNPQFGRGGRGWIVEMDEFAFWKDDAAANTSVGMNSDCIIYTSTPHGSANEFASLYLEGTKSKFRMHWRFNPSWVKGMYRCAPGCLLHEGGGVLHSKRYDFIAEDKYNWNPSRIAQELDMDFLRSAGTPVFNVNVAHKCIQRLKEKRPKFLHVRLDYKASGAQTLGSNRSEWFKQARKWPVAANLNGGGPFRVHKLPLSCKDQQCACKGTGMHTYAVGGDVSQGLPHGDDSVLYVADLTVGAIVAEWCGRIPPEDLAIEWAKIIRFYGTASGHWRDAFATIEANGPGLGVCHALEKLGVNQFVSQSDAKLKRTWDNQLGYWIHAQNKYAHISEYLAPQIGRLEANGYPALYNPFIEFWEQTLTFVTHASQEGEINPDKPKCGAQRGKKDDRVMAMLALVYGATMHFTKMKGHFTIPRKRPTVPEAVTQLNRLSD